MTNRGGVEELARPNDVIIYVGRSRIPYTIATETLQGSYYFRAMIDQYKGRSNLPPIVIDCEESVFQNLLSLLRYRSLDALPPMSDEEMFKLRKEMEFYGIHDLCSPKRRTSVRAQIPGLLCVKSASRHCPLAELPDFPYELNDASKLVLVSRLEDDVQSNCGCTPPRTQSCWALSFHHLHAFCTRCGSTPSMPPKLLAEMFMAAALYYSTSTMDTITQKRWSVGSDSTCSLKLLESKSCCICSCSEDHHTLWAVNTYHSHAFCTRCGGAAEGSVLVCILLTMRYGGLHKSPKVSLKREHLADLPIIRVAPKLKASPPQRKASVLSRSPHTSLTSLTN